MVSCSYLHPIGSVAGKVGDDGGGWGDRVRGDDERVGGGTLALLGEGAQGDALLGERGCKW